MGEKTPIDRDGLECARNSSQRPEIVLFHKNIVLSLAPERGALDKMLRMKAFRGVVKNGVVVLERGKLPEGTVVTVTASEGEVLRATISNAFRPRKRPEKIRLRPTPTMTKTAG
jgi:hypothetical protein